MKIKMTILILFVSGFLFAQDKKEQAQIVEISCGLCKFDMPSLECELAIRIDNKTYFVDGTNIDAHGDAHSADGFCQAIRKAEIVGEIVGDRFKVSSLKLIPISK